MEKQRFGLGATEATVRTDELLEGSDFTRARVESAQYNYVTHVPAAVQGPNVIGRSRAVRSKRVDPFTAGCTLRRYLAPAVRSEDNERAGDGGPEDHGTDVRVRCQTSYQVGVAAIYDVADRSAGQLRQIDVSETA
jgi:hypothetical protein